jgi:hypothetical protein
VIRGIVEEPKIIHIGPNGPRVDIPLTGLTAKFHPIETLPDVGTFADRNQPSRSVVQLLPTDSQNGPILFMRVADLEKRRFEVKPFLVDRPRTTRAKVLQSALELYKDAKVFPQMPVRVQHVPLEEKRIHVPLFSPVVISDLLESFTDFPTETDVARLAAKRDVLDRIPEIRALRWVGQETPVVVFAQQIVGPPGRRRLVLNLRA